MVRLICGYAGLLLLSPIVKVECRAQPTPADYAENAWRLKGKLMLVVGEMDKNVDPSSTLQVVDRLIKAGKDFDLLFVPGGGHGAGGQYGERKLMDFFVRNLTSQPTPDWNTTSIELKRNRLLAEYRRGTACAEFCSIPAL